MVALLANEKKKLKIRKSKNGNGIFTLRNLTVGQTIFEITGTLITCDEDDDLDDETRSNAFRYSKYLYISPKGRLGDYLNHSCNPNAKVVKKGRHLFIVAIEKILKDNEILIDYSTILADDDIWEMECNCGAMLCRSIVKRFSKLPAATKKAYLKAGIVPRHILIQ